jgi:hypothetical protein
MHSSTAAAAATKYAAILFSKHLSFSKLLDAMMANGKLWLNYREELWYCCPDVKSFQLP